MNHDEIKEINRKAAVAVGIPYFHFYGHAVIENGRNRELSPMWNDADAFKCIHALQMNIYFSDNAVTALAHDSITGQKLSDHGGDRSIALRHAVSLLAAQLHDKEQARESNQ